MKTQVIINKAHNLMDDQIKQLNAAFGVDNWERCDVPETGWNKPVIVGTVADLKGSNCPVVMLSPIPLMLGLLAASSVDTYVFHNDRRDKKELPNGKIVFSPSKEGWELIKVN